MKKVSVNVCFALIICFIAAPAFPLSYEIDVGGDGVFESGQIINVSPQSTVTIDLYIAGYSCPPDDKLFGLDAYFLFDSSIVQATNCYPSCPPFQLSTSGCPGLEQNILRPVASTFSFVPVTGGRQKFATLEIEFIQDDAYVDLVLAEDLILYGYPYHTESIVVDCNLLSRYATDAVVTMIRTADPPCYCDFSGDGRVGVADMVIMKDEFLRSDCDVNPCQADCNGDDSVNLTDLSILKSEFNRRDCPDIP